MKIQIGDQVRDMTPEELANHNQILANMEAEKIKLLEREQARKSAVEKLSTLGLTEAEIAALLGV